MSRFDYASGRTAEQSRNYIRSYFEQARKSNFNIIYFQVRGNADAFYHSAYEPWSKILTGILGADPGWDPLQFAIDRAHEQGLELHAWINTFPAWRSGEKPPTASIPEHPYRAHPEWVVCDSSGKPMNPKFGYITFSPGIPAVQQHIQKVLADLVDNYDVDGIHFDYIRYPEWSNRHGYSHDTISEKRFASEEGNPHKLDWHSWQREQVNNFVAESYNLITGLKPWVKVSAAVIGSHHRARWNGYYAVDQDARTWLSRGKMDFIAPMTYTGPDHPTVPFGMTTAEWKEMRYLGRPIFPGIAVHKAGHQIFWNDIFLEIGMLRSARFEGMSFFSSRPLKKAFLRLKEIEFKYPAAVPPMPWKNIRIPDKPVITNWNATDDTLFISWQMQNNVRFFVYHKPADGGQKRLIHISPLNANGAAVAFTVEKGDTLLVSAVNRAGIEGEAIEPAQTN